MPGDPLGLHGRQRLARLREQVPHHQRRVAHHVVEDPATLQPAAPEPRRMRPAVLLRRARQIRSPRELCPAGPEQRPSRLHLRREELVLEIPRLEPRPPCQRRHLLRLGDIPRQRLLAGEPDQLTPPALDGVDDLLHVLDAGVIGSTEPDRVDTGIGHHRLDRLVRRRVAQVELARHPCRRCGVAGVGAPHAQHIAIAHLLECAQMELCVEPAADDPDAQALWRLHLRSPYFLSHSA